MAKKNKRHKRSKYRPIVMVHAMYLFPADNPGVGFCYDKYDTLAAAEQEIPAVKEECVGHTIRIFSYPSI